MAQNYLFLHHCCKYCEFSVSVKGISLNKNCIFNNYRANAATMRGCARVLFSYEETKARRKKTLKIKYLCPAYRQSG